MKKIIRLGTAAVLACLSCAVLASCGASYNSIKRMQRMEEGVANPTTAEELRDAIKKYDARAMDLVSTQEQVGIWYKILGTRYIDKKMYNEAFDCFQRAIDYYPDNANLYYYLAICAGYKAHSELDYNATGGAESTARQQRYLRLAESAYKRALAIDPKYYRAMYGISVLYVFEFEGESANAIPYLEEFTRTQTRDTNGLFLLANAYYQNYEFQKAIDIYDRLITLNPNAESTAQAKANKAQVLEAQAQSN